MAEFIHHANEVLRAAGIPAGSRPAAALLETLADRARDWAERAQALGGRLDPGAATCIAARSLAADPDLQRRLDALELDAGDLLAKIQAVAEGYEGEPAAPPPRRRRWGDEAQPRGRADDPFAAEVQVPAMTSAPPMIGIPVYGPGGERLGVIEALMLDGGERVTGVRLSGAGLSC